MEEDGCSSQPHPVDQKKPDHEDICYEQCYEFDMVQKGGKTIEDYLCCICFGMIRDAVEMPCCKKFIGNTCRLRVLTDTFKEFRYLRFLDFNVLQACIVNVRNKKLERFE